MKWVSLHKYYPNMVQAIRSIINEELRSTGQSSDFAEYIKQYGELCEKYKGLVN